MLRVPDIPALSSEQWLSTLHCSPPPRRLGSRRNTRSVTASWGYGLDGRVQALRQAKDSSVARSSGCSEA